MQTNKIAFKKFKKKKYVPVGKESDERRVKLGAVKERKWGECNGLIEKMVRLNRRS